jgi:hypothetical protein
MEFDLEVIETKSYGSDDSGMNVWSISEAIRGKLSRTYGSRSPNAKMTTDFLERDN